jgi:outer membrane protein
MKTMFKAAVFAAGSLLSVGAAQAQKAPAAVIVTVDTQKIFATCNACKAAQTQLQSQAQQLQTLAQSLGTPIRTEAQAIEKAAGGKAPDAALQGRINALQTKQNQANQQLAQRQEQFQRNRAYVAQQINQKLDPIITSVMQQRGANLALDAGATLAAGASLDVTNDVLSQLNSQLPNVSTTAPAGAAQSGR